MVIEKSSENTGRIAELLLSKKVGALPCDTIYGLSAVVSEETAERIYDIKNRSQSKSFITLMTLSQLRTAGLDVPEILFDVWPAPLTAILNGNDGKTHAVRVPSDSFVLSIMEKSGPIYSTSVNISGEKSLLTFDDVYAAFSGKLDFIVKAEVSGTSASTMIDMTSKPYKVIRHGSFDPSAITG